MIHLYSELSVLIGPLSDYRYMDVLMSLYQTFSSTLNAVI